jgi:hypothetical protein
VSTAGTLSLSFLSFLGIKEEICDERSIEDDHLKGSSWLKVYKVFSILSFVASTVTRVEMIREKITKIRKRCLLVIKD